MVSGWVIGLIVIALILALIGIILNGYAISQVSTNASNAKTYATWSIVVYIVSFIILVGALIAYFYTSRTEIAQVVSEKLSTTASKLSSSSATLAEMQRQARIAELQSQISQLKTAPVIVNPIPAQGSVELSSLSL